jgi:hypothetical protein
MLEPCNDNDTIMRYGLAWFEINCLATFLIEKLSKTRNRIDEKTIIWTMVARPSNKDWSFTLHLENTFEINIFILTMVHIVMPNYNEITLH